ncbi:MarR family transcriptional regulator [Rhodoferax sp.]|uniref:MarR family transcriptional regulator n=1 Tax=Rhodoferax sp. TaxID=50421 RepID=UPI0026015E09|nr:MarR family transcriptional regulator [Rhodoferax sp.]
MPESFAPFESAIKAIATQIPGAQPREAILTRLLLHIGTRLGEVVDVKLRELGLNYTTWTTLVVLYSHPGHRMLPSELSTFIHTSRTHCSRIADDLAKKGWVERVASEVDRREVYMQLTDAGQALVETVQPQRRQQYSTLWAGFSAEEMDQFDLLLRKVLRYVDG